MKKVIVFIIIVLAIIISMLFISQNKNNIKTKETLSLLKIGSVNVLVETAITRKETEKGLSGRDRLKENQGMLFIFDKPDFYKFWMKDMKFPIDIIWMDSNGKIVEISENIPAPENNSQLKIYTPQKPIQYLLEVNAGFSSKNNIKAGDFADLSNIFSNYAITK